MITKEWFNGIHKIIKFNQKQVSIQNELIVNIFLILFLINILDSLRLSVYNTNCYKLPSQLGL